MTDRSAEITAFLAATRWADARRAPLAGDASNRKYERLTGPGPGDSHVLMDAAPERGEDVRPFVAIADWLSAGGLAAPQVIARDEDRGLLVLEDLGDDLFARVLDRAPEQEMRLYSAATEVLAALHRLPPPAGLTAYDPALMASLAGLAQRWYRLEIAGAAAPREAAFAAAFEPVLARHAAPRGVVILRDYHAENLIWRPEQEGLARVGLLDFQDALVGHPAYDLASLLRDARRDVGAETREAMVAHFLSLTGNDEGPFRAALAVLGVQRNLRILGVFARLSLHFGKPQYVRLIPRVWDHLLADLAHPALDPVRDRVLADLHEPAPAHLKELEDRCGTIPTR